MYSYPIISKHPSLKPFNRNYKAFWESLIKNTRDDILFSEEDDLITTIVAHLIAQSNSQVRALRHTATLTLYHIMGALIETLDSFRQTLATTEKQLKTAQKKKEKKAQTDISARSETLQANIIKVEEAIGTIYEGYDYSLYVTNN
jgi:cohesin complex subunit SA-1/2